MTIAPAAMTTTTIIGGEIVNAALDHRSQRSASVLSNEKRTVRQKAPEIRSGSDAIN